MEEVGVRKWPFRAALVWTTVAVLLYLCIKESLDKTC